jgi:uncharacterized protein (TIGR02246 family)
MKNLTIAALVLVAIAVGVAGLAQGKTDPALDKLNAEFVAAFNAKDAAKVASFYTEDATLMPPNHAMVKGRPNIEAYWRGAFEQGMTSLALRPMESAIAGSQAFEAGTATVTIKTGGSPTTPGGVSSGGVVSDTSKYLVVFKRTAEGWKMAYDIYNSDQPAPTPLKKSPAR